MKFNFKKIASVLTSTVMLSSTIAFAAAANFPEPFVKDGVGQYAIVVGADGTDSNAATQLDAFLEGMVTESDDSTAPISVDGESWMVADGDDKFNLGSNVTAVEDELDDDQLENLLSDLTYTNDDGDDFDYDQDITLSDDLEVGLQTDDDDNTYIGMDLADGDTVLTYTLTFDDAAEGGATDGANEFPELSNTYITMLGKEYYVSDVENLAGTGVEITLLDSANKVSLNKGESQTISVGDASYDVELTYVHSTSGVKLSVDGVDTGLLDEGDTKKLSDGVYVSILENLAGEDADADSALVSIGTGEIVLTNGEEVQINGDDISDIDAYDDAALTATIVNSTTDLESVSFVWALGQDTEVKSGDELVLPGFETVKVIMGDFVTKAEEVTTIENSGDDQIVIKTEVVDGDYTLPILFTGNDVNFTATGEDANTKLWTSDSDTLVINQTGSLGDDYFVISTNSGDEGESYILAITDIDEDTNDTTIENLVTGDDEVVEVGDDVRFGDITLTLDYSNGRNSTVSITSPGSEGFNYLVTKEGMMITLPNSTATNLSQGIDPVTLTVTEETGDDNTIGSGQSFTVTLVVGDDGAEVSATNLTEVEETDGSDVSIAYVESELATKVALDDAPDQSTLDITYHGEEAYVEAYVAAGDTVANGGGSSSGTMVVTDTSSEFESVKSTKNLIVLGGTCVNRVAAKVLGVDASYPVCGSDWETLTTVGAGEFLIQTVTSPYSESKVAMLVAGYAQTDTANAVSTLKVNEDIEVANNVKYLNSGTTLTKS